MPKSKYLNEIFVGKQLRFSVIQEIFYKNKAVWIRCLCGCGNIFSKSLRDIRGGTSSTSCGCQKYCKKMLKEKHHNWTGYKDITGDYWCKLRSGAKRRNIEFNITMEEVWEIYEKQNRKCVLTNLDINIGNREIQTASLDRIDSRRPYCVDNCQWLHKTINKLKQSFNNEEVIYFCKLISDKNKEVS